MAAAYSYDLRLKVMKYLASGKSIKETSKVYGIHRKTIMDWRKLKQVSGDVKAREGYQKGSRIIIRDIVQFKAYIDANNSKSSIELAKGWIQAVCASTIVNTLRRLGYTYKKSFHPSKTGCWQEG